MINRRLAHVHCPFIILIRDRYCYVLPHCAILNCTNFSISMKCSMQTHIYFIIINISSQQIVWYFILVPHFWHSKQFEKCDIFVCSFKFTVFCKMLFHIKIKSSLHLVISALFLKFSCYLSMPLFNTTSNHTGFVNFLKVSNVKFARRCI